MSKHNLAFEANLPPAGKPPISEIWRAVRARLRSEYGETVFSAELARLRASEDGPDGVAVTAPNAFSRAWVEDHAGARIRALWASLDAAGRTVRILEDGERPARHAEPARTPAPVAEAPRSGARTRSERFTFDTFMVGPSNELAAAAAKSVIGSPAPFNPVFFYGDYGVGKTHLLHGVAHAVELGSRRALYLTAEEFLSGFVSAMRARDTLSFKDSVRNVDVLLIDDVHFIAGKPKTEDEFLHTIASLIGDDRQVVLASHCPPGELAVCDERLRSLLRGGFACELRKPDLDLRRKILDCKIEQAKAHYPHLDVPETVREFLAARVTTSARELEGVLNNVIGRTALMNRAVTLDTVETALRDLALAGERRVTVDEIQKTVARRFNVKVADIVSKRRTQSIVRPRHVAMYLAKTLTTRSLPDIGRRFGKRDHSTVIHAVRKISDMIEAGDPIRDEIEAIAREIQG